MSLTEINLTGIGLKFPARPGQKLSEAIWLSGYAPPVSLCGGLALCGRCRCRFLENAPTPVPAERQYFSQTELDTGWRLACRHKVPEQGILRLELPAAARDAKFAVKKGNRGTEIFLGYDLGTTTIHWQAVDTNGDAVAEGRQWNPQGAVGADVISRLAFASTASGLGQLACLSQTAFSSTVVELQKNGFSIKRVCLAANTAMTCVFFGKDIAGLQAAPYTLPFNGNVWEKLRLSSGTVSLYVPPLPAPFVGGDITAGLALLLEKDCPRPFLLLDLGTNAELALLTEDHRLFLASAPLGPAMEGIGPQCGQPAGTGVITSFKVTPFGLEAVFFDDSHEAQGISATGYLSLLAQLLAWGLMDNAGKFCLPGPNAMPLSRKMASGLISGLAGSRFELPQNQFLTAQDVELLLKVKATLAVAIGRILAAAGLSAGDLANLYLAGALGLHASLPDLLALGFVSQACAKTTILLGNSSLAGACLLARKPEHGTSLANLCQAARVIDLANDPDFLQDYLAAMKWEAA